jgi:RimJ/RimL family protein N-acetyltransferase
MNQNFEEAFPSRICSLRDGRSVELRAMGPDDEAELLQAFERMPAEARYMRFMRVVRQANVDRLRQVLQSMPGGGYGIVASVPASDGEDIVGSTILISGRDPATCEFAISVASTFAGAGLASTLLKALIEVAKARGIREMEGFVLAGNEAMLRLARKLGFEIARDPDDTSVRLCTLRLGGDQSPA